MADTDSACWWSDITGAGHLGRSTKDGLAYRRHTGAVRPGFWTVSVDGWAHMTQQAVVDDFGNLVQVPA